MTPIDAWLDDAEATVSQGVRELACRLNQGAASFAKATENLARAAQIEISKESLRQVVEGEGRAVLRALGKGQLRPTWMAEDCHTEEGKTRVYLGCDGVKVPLVTEQEKQKRRQKVRQKRRQAGKKAKPLLRAKTGADNSYKEFRVVVFYDQSQKHCHVAATRGNHEAAGRLMQREANRLGLHRAEERVGNVDGAVWIRNQIEFYGLVDALGLDFYHLSENVHKARRAVFGEQNAEGESWAGELMHCFKHDGYRAAWQRLTDWRSQIRSRTKREAADGLLHYVVERREMIRYPEFLNRGWQIGSGPTEAQCKTTTMRVKGSGKRWDADNAEALMALACLDNSHAWQQYWLKADPETN
jgi:hypothetical protein